MRPRYTHRLLWAGCLLACACTTTQVVHEQGAFVESFRPGSIETLYSEEIPYDPRERARELRAGEDVAQLLEGWLDETQGWGGPDSVRIEVSRFDLANSAMGRAFLGTTGDDTLGADVSLLRDGRPVATFQVEHTLANFDRSRREVHDESVVLTTLTEAVAWSIAYELTPFDERRAIFEIGKRQHIRRAIEMLEMCGELSYAETLKYTALGQISPSIAASAEARRMKQAFGSEPEPCF